MRELAERAKADLKTFDAHGVAGKLGAIRAAAKRPLETVADVADVASCAGWAPTGGRAPAASARSRRGRDRPSWARGRRPPSSRGWRRKRPRGGEAVHWTLERLRTAIGEEFGVDMGSSTIWVWLRKEGWRQKAPRPRHHAADAASGVRFRT
jgi:hypothetical protein